MKAGRLFTSLFVNIDKNWLFKYKIYHIFFWCIYHYAWSVINGGTPVEVLRFMVSSPKFAFYVIFQALAVYFNLYFLIPRYLETGRYLLYLFYFALATMVASAMIALGYYWHASIQGLTVFSIFGHSNFSFFFLTYTLPSTLTSMLFAMSIKLTKHWITTKRREKVLEQLRLATENEKLETELKFLRSQLNPHFLFNTINSIFVLIHKNQDQASEALAKFSDLLRYQLYECNEHLIPLRQEVDYLNNYLELEKLRQDTRRIDVIINIQKYLSLDLFIAPFILIPFIENAFKHVSHATQIRNSIVMDLSIQNSVLHFKVVNTVSKTHTTAASLLKDSGVGLTNVQRRLELIYPKKYELVIEHLDNQFSVDLRLELVRQFVSNADALKNTNNLNS